MAIYDEPEAGIDLWSFDRLTETFRDIHETRDDRSIVIISHQERIIQLADDIVCLRDGRIQDMGPARGNPSQARLHRPRLPRLPAHPADRAASYRDFHELLVIL